MKALLGKKIGMTQIFSSETGAAIPVTVIDVSNNVVAKQLKSGEAVSKVEIGKDKEKKSTKADSGNYKKLGFVPKFKKFLEADEELASKEIGTELKADVFQVNDYVDVTGTTKGKGFQGVMKRWGYKGGQMTHGQSNRERAPGSIASGQTLGRIYRGQKMGGRMGRVQQTIQRLKVVDVDVEGATITVAGSIQGNKKGYLLIKQTKKA